MDDYTFNVTTVLVQTILRLTHEQRSALSLQHLCQYTYCKLPINDPDDNNQTCHVTAARLSLPGETQQYDDSYSILAVKYINLYIYPILIFMGIFGNGLSCFIMFVNVRRNGYSANFYLALLALVDCLFLIGSAIPDWISHIHSKLDVKLLSDLFCRFVYWFGNFITHLSAGLVVTVTVERFIAIQYPLFAHKINTVKHAHIVLIILISFFFLLDSRVFIIVKHFQKSIHIVLSCHNDTYVTYERRETSRCGIANENNKQIWVFIDFAVYTLIPFLIIVTLNSLIINRLIGAQRSRQRMFHRKNQPEKFDQNNFYPHLSESHQIITEKIRWKRYCRSLPTAASSPSITMRSPTICLDQNGVSPATKQSIVQIESTLDKNLRSQYQYEHHIVRQTTNTNNMRLTVLLLFVSCSFLILTLPAVVFNVIWSIKFEARSSYHHNVLSTTDEYMSTNMVQYYTIARLLMIVNHSINFILYFVVGKRFRRDLKNLCFSYWRRLLD